MQLSNGLQSICNGFLKPVILSIAALLLICTRGVAQEQTSLLLKDEFLNDAREAIELAYNLEYQESLDHLSGWQNSNPDHPLWEFWPILDKWWYIVSDLEQEDYDESFFSFLDAAIEKSEAHLDDYPDDVDALIIKATAYGFSARLHSNRHNWYSSLRNARRAMNYLRDVEEIYPDLPDTEFGNAMYKYFSAFLRDEYPAVRIISWILPSGDREEGLELLEYVAQEGIILSPESRYFLGHINLHFEESLEQALPHLETMANSYPNNSYFTRLLIRAHFRGNNYHNAKRMLDDAFQQEFYDPDHIILAANEEFHYMYGRILIREQNFQEAVEHLKKSEEASKKLTDGTDRRFQVEAGYYLGQAYLQLDDEDNARRQFSKIANADTDSNLKERAQDRLDRMN